VPDIVDLRSEKFQQLIADALRERMDNVADDESIFTLTSGVKTFVSLQNGRIRFVQDLDPQRDRGGHTCLLCGVGLTPKIGSQVSWHFAHEKGAPCSSEGGGGLNETLLHKTAKHLVARMSHILLDEPLIEKSWKFEDIQEVAFPDRILAYRDAVCEVAPPGFDGSLRPDVLASLDAWPGRQIMIEIAVTHPVGDAKRALVVEADYDMIEISLASLLEDAKLRDVDISTALLRDYLVTKAHRRWIHSRVQRILGARVILEEARRELAEARSRVDGHMRLLPGLNAGSSELTHRWGGDIPVLSVWCEKEASDLQAAEIALNGAIQKLKSSGQQSGSVTRISDLQPDTSFLKVRRFLEQIETLPRHLEETPPILEEADWIVNGASHALSWFSEEDRRIAERVDDAMEPALSAANDFQQRCVEWQSLLTALLDLEPEALRLSDCAKENRKLILPSVSVRLQEIQDLAEKSLEQRRQADQRAAEAKAQSAQDPRPGSGPGRPSAKILPGPVLQRHPQYGHRMSAKDIEASTRNLMQELQRYGVPDQAFGAVLFASPSWVLSPSVHDALEFQGGVRALWERIGDLVAIGKAAG